MGLDAILEASSCEKMGVGGIFEASGCEKMGVGGVWEASSPGGYANPIGEDVAM